MGRLDARMLDGEKGQAQRMRTEKRNGDENGEVE